MREETFPLTIDSPPIFITSSLSLSASLAASAPIGQSSANQREFAVFSLVYIGCVWECPTFFCMNTAQGDLYSKDKTTKINTIKTFSGKNIRFHFAMRWLYTTFCTLYIDKCKKLQLTFLKNSIIPSSYHTPVIPRFVIFLVLEIVMRGCVIFNRRQKRQKVELQSILFRGFGTYLFIWTIIG